MATPVELQRWAWYELEQHAAEDWHAVRDEATRREKIALEKVNRAKNGLDHALNDLRMAQKIVVVALDQGRRQT